LAAGPRPAHNSSRDAHVQRLEARRLLSQGTTDPFYGTGGFAAPEFHASEQTPATQVIALPDGRAYVAAASAERIGLARLTLEGELDPTFGTGGKVVVDPTPYRDFVEAMVLQPDGKIVLAGNEGVDFELVRFNSDGTLDNTFGTGGVVIVDVGRDPVTGFGSDWCESLLLQPDGKLVAIGHSDNGNHTRGVIARFNPNGSLDAAFGSGGRVVTELAAPSGWGEFSDGLLLPGGKLLVIGGHGPAAGGTGEPGRPLLARYDPDGRLDSTFGSGGIASSSLPYGGATAITPAPGGDYYVTLGGNTGGALSRWNADGTVDTAFGTGGVSRFLESTYGPADVVVQPDGSILASHGDGPGFALARFLPSGELTFVARQAFDLFVYTGGSIALQPNGRALVVGGAAASFRPLPRGPLVYRYYTMPDPPPGARLEDGILYVTASESADTVAVARDAQNWSVTVNGVTQQFPAPGVRRVDVRLLGGDDVLTTTGDADLGMVDLGTGNDSAHVGPAGLLRLLAGDGDDSVEFAADAGPVAGTPPAMSVDAGAGDDLLTFAGTPAVDSFHLMRDVSEFGGHRLNHPGFERVAVAAGAGNDVVLLDDDSPAAPGNPGAVYSISGDDGNDVITVAKAPARKVHAIRGGAGDDQGLFTPRIDLYLSFEAGAGNDIARVSTLGGAHTFTITDDRVQTALGLSVTLGDPAALESLEVNALEGNDTFTLTRSGPGIPTTINGGAGADRYTATNGILAGSANVLFRGGGQVGDAATLSDESRDPHAYRFGGGAVHKDGTLAFRHEGLDLLTFTANPLPSSLVAGKTFTISDAAGVTTLTLTGGAGGDVFATAVDPAAGLGTKAGGRVVLSGNGGDDTFRLTPDAVATFDASGGIGTNDRLEIDFASAGPGARLTSTAPGNGRYTFGQRQPVSFTGIESLNDLPAPAGAALGLDPGRGDRLSFTFAADVGASLSPDDLLVQDLRTSEPLAGQGVTVAYDAAANTATFTFPARLADGNYRATLAAAGVRDAAGTAMRADFGFDFFVLTGDVNRDRAVNGADFAILAGNFGKRGMTYGQGDVNGDGAVNGTDFAMLAGNFGKLMPAPSPPPPQLQAPATGATAPLTSPAKSAPAARPDAKRRSAAPARPRPRAPLPRRPVAGRKGPR
jgi:uncharacterized delta-60 repeat protein